MQIESVQVIIARCLSKGRGAIKTIVETQNFMGLPYVATSFVTRDLKM
jgi:hypothetical protein